MFQEAHAMATDVLAVQGGAKQLTVRCFKTWSTDHSEILLWSVVYILKESTANFGRISKSNEISLVRRTPGMNHPIVDFKWWT